MKKEYFFLNIIFGINLCFFVYALLILLYQNIYLYTMYLFCFDLIELSAI